jgi:DNA mismatch endonuclease (patch repair protein)
MKANRSRDTGPEQAIRSWLFRKGFRFRKDVRIACGARQTRPDVVFAGARVAVFIDGCFWHGCRWHGSEPRHNRWYWRPKIAGNRERDRRSTRALRRLGWTVLRFWEHTSPEIAAVRVAAAVTAGRATA